MPISQIDYEPPAETAETEEVKAGVPVADAHRAEPARARGSEPALERKTAVSDVAAPKAPERRTPRRISVSHATADVPLPQAPPPVKALDTNSREDSPLPPDAETAEAPAEAPPVQSPVEDRAAEQPAVGSSPAVPADPAQPENQAGNAVPPEGTRTGRDFQNRFDAAQGRISNQTQNTEELYELLDQAVALLEALANHPALTSYATLKQRLDNIEQILHSSANVR